MRNKNNSDLIRKNRQLNKTQYDLKTLDVVDVIQSAPDTYTVYLSLDAPYDADINHYLDLSKVAHTSFIQEEGLYFPVGSGLGIPPVVDSQILQRLKTAFKSPQENDLEYCQLHKGFAGPDLAAPSKELIGLIVKRAKSTHLDTKATLLRNILKDTQKLSELQATYDVADILEHFPQTITAEELWELQPPISMTKTYTVLPEQSLSKTMGKPCFSLSVKAQRAKCVQNMLGESPAIQRIHEGAVSSYLSQLKAGDKLEIVDIIKPQKNFKSAYEADRDIVFLAQGNAHERSLSYLIEKQADPSALKQKFILVSGFKTEQDIPQNQQLEALKQNGTLSEAYYALSRDRSAPRKNNKTHYCTGKRVTDVLKDIKLDQLKNPIFYIAGSTLFCDAVKDIITDQLGADTDIRISNSKARISEPAVAL